MGKGKYGTAISGGGGVLDKSIIDRIMLRFRPIAPKPAANGSSNSGEVECNNKKNVITNNRPKRKYVRVRRNNKPRKKKEVTPSSDQVEEHKSFVTLQLLPERSDGQDLLPWSGNVIIESRVTVECVTDTCAAAVYGGEGSDLDRLRNLEVDTCPGFVSDGGFDSVWWVNEAYKKMVTGSSDEDEDEDGYWKKKEFRVCLVVMNSEKLFPSCCKYLYPAAFGCRVRVEYTWRDRRLSRTVPCDVWRMECGWFAWRLDVEAALSLGI